MNERRIFVNIPDSSTPQPQFPTNRISTTKYTLFNFVIKNLMEQFRGLANIYFLATVFLQLIPKIGASSSIFVSAIPIIFILTVTALKDAYEDYRRHRLDNIFNSSLTWTSYSKNNNYSTTGNSIFHNLFYKKTKQEKEYCTVTFYIQNLKCIKPMHDLDFGICLGCSKYIKTSLFNTFKQKKWKMNREKMDKTRPKFSMKGWQQTYWKDLIVGDFILLKNNDSVPADILLISTSENGAVCYAETKSLDGETNLKVKEALKDTSYISTLDDCISLKVVIETPSPNADLYSQDGNIIINEQSVSFNLKNTLLRGSVVRNTDFAIGIVLFTGKDTKIMLNSGETPSKRSKVDKLLNPMIIVNFIILLILCLTNGIVEGYYTYVWLKEKAPFTDPNQSFWLAGGLTFGASIIMYQNIVPISLYITIEAVKTVQIFFLHYDLELYDPETNERCVPKTWNIADDLGQIDYIFSDKTGTLTENKMEFKKCSINGKVYGIGLTDVSRVTTENRFMTDDQRDLFEKEKEDEMRNKSNRFFDNPYMSIDPLSFVDPDIFDDLDSRNEQSECIQKFFMLLALCHTVLNPKKDPLHPTKFVYAAQSPDEEALVKCAKDMGFIFLERHLDTIVINVHSHIQSYKILNVIEFNSNRKRMSIILESNDEIYILIKGADSVIYDRLAPGQTQIMNSTKSQLEEFANEGLRTLCLAQRKLSRYEYEVWNLEFHKAKTSIHDREFLVEQVAELIERDLELIGATAIEDKLQEMVPECIETLRKAGIKIWVLTGDKKETAINIGFASNLLSKDMKLVLIQGDNIDTITLQIKESIEFYKSMKENLGLVIDGQTLAFVLENDETKELFLVLGLLCKSAICCRVSPKQKAEVVKLVKEGTDSMCLAIGDGANDVSMIQEAHVGVGISGQEGLQAAMSSDFVIGKFKFLSRLLLVHGHWSYYRITSMILNFFYKNLIWVFALFWYQIYSGFTADLLYDYKAVMCYNLLFTSLPAAILGVFDQDINSRFLMSYPQLYRSNINKKILSIKSFLIYITDSIYQSAICFFCGYFLYKTTTTTNGSVIDKDQLGSAIAVFIVIIANIYVGLSIKNWTWIVFVVILFSTFSMNIYVLIDSQAAHGNGWSSGFQLDQKLYSEWSFWAAILCVFIASLFPRFIIQYFQQTAFPTDIDIIREEQIKLKVPLIDQQRDIDIEQHTRHLTLRKSLSIKPLSALLTTDSNFSNHYGTDANDTSSRDSVRSGNILDMGSHRNHSHSGYAFAYENSRADVEAILGLDEQSDTRIRQRSIEFRKVSMNEAMFY